MKNKVIILLSFLYMGSMLYAGGNKEGSKKQESGRKMYGYMVPASVPQRTAVGQVVILQMLDMLDVDIVARPSTKREISARYKDKTEIGMPMRVDLEKLKEVNPDFYLATGDRGTPIAEQLKALNIPAEFLQTTTYTDILNSMRYLGEVYNKREKAAAYVKQVEDVVAKVKASNKNKKPLKVLIIAGFPNSMSIHTEGSFVGTLIKVLGAENIWTDNTVKNTTVPMNLELVKATNPDVILLTSHGDAKDTAKMYEKDFENAKKVFENFGR
ncbi:MULTISPECIES: ABC transporter substrate-binding protein [unclassified Treponema]|uniref:ABC transporter substrate-binding protein n=1 Tax=unclassified Treponema TaxID=2638727 RepID=UPI0020A47A0F|nr:MULTISPECIES: ABC transporter substrate-binding protein [unclassified Treponema]